MAASALYTGMLLGSFAAWTGVQYGWHPPFAVVWDGLSSIVVGFALYLVMIGSCWGLTAGIAIPGLPPRWRLTPAMMAFSVLSFLFYGITELSRTLTLVEIVQVLGEFAGYGLLVGCVLTVGSAIQNEGGASDTARERNARTGGVCAIVLVGCSAFLVIPRSEIQPEIKVERRYSTADSELTLGHASMLGERIAILKVKNGATVQVVTLEPSEWRTLLTILQAAERSQSEEWRIVGGITDTASEPTHVDVSAGKGVRLKLSDAHDPPTTFDLPPQEIEGFNQSNARILTAIEH